jgi:hypothetical protein
MWNEETISRTCCKNITEIDIPIAPNPLMSIFGDRSRISVRINGAIDINAGFRIESSDQQSVFLRPTHVLPEFPAAGADQCQRPRRRQTEHPCRLEHRTHVRLRKPAQNQVHRIRRRNHPVGGSRERLAADTDKSLIQGSGALFGLKAEFQLGPLRLQTIASQKKGESSRLAINGGAQEQTFERHAYEYSDNHYFIDAAYRDVDPASGESPYEAYYNYRALFPDSNKSPCGRASGPVHQGNRSLDFAACQQRRDHGSGRTRCRGVHRQSRRLQSRRRKISPSPTPIFLDPNIRVEPKSGEIEVARFKRLQKDVDYFYNAITGVITLNSSVQDDQVIAAAYRIEGPDAETAPTTSHTAHSPVTAGCRHTRTTKGRPIPLRGIVLKLIKPKNLGPSFTQVPGNRRSAASTRSIHATSPQRTWRISKSSIVPADSPTRKFSPTRTHSFSDSSVSTIRTKMADRPDGKIDFIPG